MSIIEALEISLQSIFTELGYDTKFAKVSLSKIPEIGDYQCNSAIPIAKILGKDSLAVASEIADKLSNENFHTSVTGQGFINIKLSDEFLTKFMNCYSITKKHSGLTIIDHGGPNIAKTMHVGHMRSAIIGNCLKRLFSYCGHEVITDAHLGDWGLQMGMIIAEIFDQGIDVKSITPEKLLEIYRKASLDCKDDVFRERAKNFVKFLQSGDSKIVDTWKAIKEISLTDIKSTYAKLGVDFDLWKGESDYQKDCEELVKSDKAIMSEGALVIPLTGIEPLILVKSDGSFLYSTTDVAALIDRLGKKPFDRHIKKPVHILYVVDKRQDHHFKSVFKATTILGYDVTPAEHIGFGTINGLDGKPFKTRDGDLVSLNTLIDDAVAKAKTYCDDDQIAKCVAISALKFADLQNDRLTDYIFDLDKILNFEGKTGPYVLYTAVRCKSILAKTSAHDNFTIENVDERNLLLKLSRFPDVLEMAYNKRQPYYLVEQMYDIASAFNSFYHEHSVIGNPNRAKLVQMVLDQITLLCDLTGIEIPERM